MEEIKFVDEETLSPYECLLRAEELWAALEPAEAEPFFERAIAGDPSAQEAYVSFAEFLKAENRPAEAKRTIERAIPLNEPFPLYKKYFILAEQEEPLASLNWYKEGVECAERTLTLDLQQYSMFKDEAHKLNREDIGKDISSACAAVAELCMEELLHIKSMKGVCEQALQRGLLHHKGPDLLTQQARYFLLVGDDQRGRLTALEAAVLLEHCTDATDELKLSLARVLSEVGEYRQGIAVLQRVDEGERDEHSLYLLAFLHFKCGELVETVDWLQQLGEYAGQFQCDPEVLQAKAELEEEVGKLPTPEETVGEEEDWMDVQ